MKFCWWSPQMNKEIWDDDDSRKSWTGIWDMEWGGGRRKLNHKPGFLGFVEQSDLEFAVTPLPVPYFFTLPYFFKGKTLAFLLCLKFMWF